MGMPQELGRCSGCRQPIYASEGPSDACRCDDGVFETLMVREGRTPTTPTQERRPNRNGDVLPDLDPLILLSATGRAEMASAQHYATQYRGNWPEDRGLVAEDPGVKFSRISPEGFDISFEQEEVAWPVDLARPTTPTRERFRVDRGLPVREPFQGRIASGQSDGQVVGRVGQRGVALRQILYDDSMELMAERQTAPRVGSHPAGTRPLESRPVDRTKIPTALERLGKVDFDDDPFK